MGKPIHVVWRENYRAHRYLEGKPVSHVAARMRYQIEGLLTLTENGLIGPEQVDGLGGWMWERFTHTLHEFELRGQRPPRNFLAGAAVPRTTHPATPPEVLAYRSRRRAEPGQVFKYGKRKWLERLVDHGELRFASGTYYRDPSLNTAIRDDELSFTVYPVEGFVDLAKVGVRGFPSRRVPGGVVLSHPTNFYVQCFSRRYALRMFNDFEADSCVVIYDAKEFGRRVMDALKSMFPDWLVAGVPVFYIDPDDPGSEPLPIPVVKPMRYAYQFEERILCHPRTTIANALDPVVVRFRPINDIAELVVLPTEAIG